MFHVELRQSAERARRLNLTVEELRAQVLAPWGRGEPVALGERAWRGGEAQLTVIEGPEVPVGSLTMGRGWSVALREGRDVTGELLPAAGPVGGGPVGGGDALLADALGLELLRRLAGGAISLQEAWRVARERDSEHAPARSLELARAAVISLSRSELATLERSEKDGEPRSLAGPELEQALDSVESWGAEQGPGALWLRRA